jgi:hypothetical protein
VVRALDEFDPTAVLVELPADCEPALRWVGHEQLRPPVALLGHVVDRPQRAAFLPFATFSPDGKRVLTYDRPPDSYSYEIGRAHV